jgi:hypothetical protein
MHGFVIGWRMEQLLAGYRWYFGFGMLLKLSPVLMLGICFFI